MTIFTTFKRLVLIGLGLAIAWHSALSFLGYSWPQNTFLFMPEDRFNDWQNSVNATINYNPYYQAGRVAISAYFPFTFLVIEPFSNLNRIQSIAGYLVVSVVLFVFSFNIILNTLIKNYNDNNIQTIKIKRFEVIMIMFITYPVIFSLDRGNIDLWIASLCLIYLSTFNGKHNMIGIICISFAIAFKGYPIAFLILKISERKYRDTFIIIAIATALSILSLSIMQGGFTHNLLGFSNNLEQFRASYVIGPNSLFGSSDPYNALRVIILIFFDRSVDHIPIWSIPLHRLYIFFSLLLAIISTYFVLAVRSKAWKKVMSISILSILFPDVANDYKLCLLIPGLLFLIFEITAKSTKEFIAILLVGLLMIPKNYLFFYNHSISMIINPLLIISLALVVLIDRNAWRNSIRLLKYTILWHITNWIGVKYILIRLNLIKNSKFFCDKSHRSLDYKILKEAA